MSLWFTSRVWVSTSGHEIVRYRYALSLEHPDLTVYIATRHTRRLPDTSTPQDRPRATIPHGDIRCHQFYGLVV